MKNTKIGWCNHTVNLWWGCNKEHIGCKNCYAKKLSNRFGNNLWEDKRKLIHSAFKDLNHYQFKAQQTNVNYTVFCGSMHDIFEDSKQLINHTKNYTTTQQLRHQLFKEIYRGKYNNLIFLFLTKRPQNIFNEIPISWLDKMPKNVWFGISISNQETADYYLPLLTKIIEYIPKKNKNNVNLFLSIEPQIGPINKIDLKNIHWVIQGAETGPYKRPFNLKWAETLNNICKLNKTPYFLKQNGLTIPKQLQSEQFPLF